MGGPTSPGGLRNRQHAYPPPLFEHDDDDDDDEVGYQTKVRQGQLTLYTPN